MELIQKLCLAWKAPLLDEDFLKFSLLKRFFHLAISPISLRPLLIGYQLFLVISAICLIFIMIFLINFDDVIIDLEHLFHEIYR